jgi:hypothetical protein
LRDGGKKLLSYLTIRPNGARVHVPTQRKVLSEYLGIFMGASVNKSIALLGQARIYCPNFMAKKVKLCFKAPASLKRKKIIEIRLIELLNWQVKPIEFVS